MSFLVIEFLEESGGGLAVVKNNWMTPRKREVFWPPIKDQKKFNRILLSGASEVDDTWKLYKIERIFCETDDYKVAQDKFNIAKVTSDLSERKEGNEQKRKRIARKVYSSDDEVENYEISSKVLKKRTFIKDLPGLPLPPPIELSTVGPSVTSTPSRSGVTYFEEANSSIQSNGTILVQTPSTSRVSPDFVFDRKAYEVLLSNVVTLKEQNKQILVVLNNTSSNNLPKLPELQVGLPMKDKESIEQFEAELQNEDVLNNFCSYLSSLGGRDLTTTTNRVLRFLLADTLAAEYSYFGKKRKKAFADLNVLRRLIFASLKITYPSAKEKDIEDIIKVWLKHAPDREHLKAKRSTSNVQL